MHKLAPRLRIIAFGLTLISLVALSAQASAQSRLSGYTAPEDWLDGDEGSPFAAFYTNLRRQEFKVDELRIGRNVADADEPVLYKELCMGLQVGTAGPLPGPFLRRVGIEGYAGFLGSSVTDHSEAERDDEIGSGLGFEFGGMMYINVGLEFQRGMEAGLLAGLGLHLGYSEYERSDRFDFNVAEFSNLALPMVAGLYGMLPVGAGTISAQGGIDYAPAYTKLQFHDTREFVLDRDYELTRRKTIGYFVTLNFASGDFTGGISYFWGPATGFRLTLGQRF